MIRSLVSAPLINFAFIGSFYLYPLVQSGCRSCAESSRHLRSILYLISERLSSINDAALQRSPKSRGTARAPVDTRLAEDCTNTSHFRRERGVPGRKRSRA